MQLVHDRYSLLFFLSLFFAMLFCCSTFWLLLERMFVVLSFECYLVRSNHWHSVDFECSKAIDPFAQHSVLIQICLAIHRNLNVSGSEWEKPKNNNSNNKYVKNVTQNCIRKRVFYLKQMHSVSFWTNSRGLLCILLAAQHNTDRLVWFVVKYKTRQNGEPWHWLLCACAIIDTQCISHIQ